MSVIERLDETIRAASDTGALIEEIDLTDADYVELMEFASRFDEAGLAQMKLDVQAQTYKDYPLKFGSVASQAELDSGQAVPLQGETDNGTTGLA